MDRRERLLRPGGRVRQGGLQPGSQPGAIRRAGEGPLPDRRLEGDVRQPLQVLIGERLEPDDLALEHDRRHPARRGCRWLFDAAAHQAAAAEVGPAAGPAAAARTTTSTASARPLSCRVRASSPLMSRAALAAVAVETRSSPAAPADPSLAAMLTASP